VAQLPIESVALVGVEQEVVGAVQAFHRRDGGFVARAGVLGVLVVKPVVRLIDLLIGSI
jgi:hypothetical protein